MATTPQIRFNLHEKYYPLLAESVEFKLIYGGRGGAKSWSVAFCLLYLGVVQTKRILCLRQYKTDLEVSVYQLMVDMILSIPEFQQHYRVTNKCVYGKNGTTIIFAGIHDAQKIKSFEGADICWIEEATQVSHRSMRILIPTIRKEGCEIWFTFNPDKADDAVYDFILNPRPSQITINITYLDNPNVSSKTISDANYDMEHNYNEYRHTWLGELMIIDDRIIFNGKFEYKNITVEDHFKGFPMFTGDRIEMKYGVDFGFVHPTVIIESFDYKGNIYITREWVAVGADLDDITHAYYNNFNYTRYTKKVYGDSASPLSINTLSKSRHNKDGLMIKALPIVPVDKGPGSVEDGLRWLKTHNKIYIDPSCPHTYENFKKYSYKVNPQGIILDEILKLNDDCIDALRYSYNEQIHKVANKHSLWTNKEFLISLQNR